MIFNTIYLFMMEMGVFGYKLVSPRCSQYPITSWNTPQLLWCIHPISQVSASLSVIKSLGTVLKFKACATQGCHSSTADMASSIRTEKYISVAWNATGGLCGSGPMRIMNTLNVFTKLLYLCCFSTISFHPLASRTFLLRSASLKLMLLHPLPPLHLARNRWVTRVLTRRGRANAS